MEMPCRCPTKNKACRHQTARPCSVTNLLSCFCSAHLSNAPFMPNARPFWLSPLLKLSISEDCRFDPTNKVTFLPSVRDACNGTFQYAFDEGVVSTTFLKSVYVCLWIRLADDIPTSIVVRKNCRWVFPRSSLQLVAWSQCFVPVSARSHCR